MATWRRKDLERRSSERSRRFGRVLRADLLIPVLALVVAGFALWQALAAQSRADILAHDLSIANGQLRNLGGYAPLAPAARSPSDEAAAPLPPLPPVGPAPSEPTASSNP